MAILFIFEKDRTSTTEIGNYNVTVQLNGAPVWKGRIEGHKQVTGWRGLIARFADKVAEDDGPDRWGCCGAEKQEEHGDYCPRCA